MDNNLDKAIKKTEREILELHLAEDVESGELKPFYRKLIKRGYGHEEAIGIIADMFESIK